MRYWKFDVCELIRDEERIKRTLVSIRRQIQLAEDMMKSPIEGTEAEWGVYKHQLELREEEYSMYLDMITLGMNDLPEVERMLLEMWLQDGFEDDYIMEHLAIKNRRELERIRKIAIERFCRIAMPT